MIGGNFVLWCINLKVAKGVDHQDTKIADLISPYTEEIYRPVVYLPTAVVLLAVWVAILSKTIQSKL